MASGLWRRGAVATVVLVVVVMGLVALEAWWRYEGMCGSPFPFLAAPYPCSSGDYVRQSLSYAIWMLTSERWWTMPGVLLVGTGVAWLIDRLRSRP